MADAFFIEGTVNGTGPNFSGTQATRYNYVNFDAGTSEQAIKPVVAWNEINNKLGLGSKGRFYFANTQNASWLVAFEADGRTVNVVEDIRRFHMASVKRWLGVAGAIALLNIVAISYSPVWGIILPWLFLVPGSVLFWKMVTFPRIERDLSNFEAR
jgi:hypothetical protein